MSSRIILVAFVAASIRVLVPAQSYEFLPAVEVGGGGSERHQLSRNANHTAAFDSEGRLWLAWWRGGETTTPTTPSAVLVAHWTTAGGWSAPEGIDDSFFDTGSGLVRYGGRHPSLAIAPDDTVWVTWQDHRHSDPDPPSNGINNIEIYADRRPAAGSFSATDLRLTESSAAHLGDNGYTPRIVVSPAGIVTVLWYDFHANAGVSDLYAIHSSPGGVFTLPQAMASLRLTNFSDRGGAPAYTVPDLEVLADGILMASWTTGTGGPAPVRTAVVPNPSATMPEQEIAVNSGGYFDPPKLALAPGGDLWAVYARRDGTDWNLAARRLPNGSGSWDAEVTLRAATGIAERFPDLEVDGAGNLHLAWIEGTNPRAIHYARYATAGGAALQSTMIAGDGNWERVTIELDEGGAPHVLYDELAGGIGRIWHRRGIIPMAASMEWMMVE